MIRRRSEWPPERLDRLRELFDAGWSHLLIANAMGVSKGVISAKLDRLGWTRDATVHRKRRAAPRKPVPKIKPPRRPTLSGTSLAVGGNRADALLRRFSWEQRS